MKRGSKPKNWGRKEMRVQERHIISVVQQYEVKARKRATLWELFNLSELSVDHTLKAARRLVAADRIKMVKSKVQPPNHLSKVEIAAIMHVDRRSVQNWIDSGELPAVDCRTAGAERPLYRVAWEDLLSFCRKRRA